MLLAFALLVATTSILAKCHGNERPKWRYDISLNTLIALFSTIMRASLLTVFLSQLKWLWLRRPRYLRAFATFDEASRGPWGSFLLIFSFKRPNLAIIGSFVTITSLAIGPFTQQAIETYPCQKILAGRKVTLPVPHWMNTIGYFTNPLSDLRLRASFINGLIDPEASRSSVAATGCITGNCTFPTFDGITHSSLGLCSRCVDTTSQIREGKTDTGWPYYYLPSMYMYNATFAGTPFYDYPRVNFSGTLDMYNPTSDFPGIAALDIFPDFPPYQPDDEIFNSVVRGAIMNFTVFGLTSQPCQQTHVDGFGDLNASGCPHNGLNVTLNGTIPFGFDTDFVATTCTLYPCVKKYFAEVFEGVLEESTVGNSEILYPLPLISGYTETEGPTFDAATVVTPCYVDGIRYDIENFSMIPAHGHGFTNVTLDFDGTTVMAPNECVYAMPAETTASLASYANAMLNSNGSCFFDWGSMETMVHCGDRWWLTTLYNAGNASFESINSTIEGMADSFSRTMRTLGLNATWEHVLDYAETDDYARFKIFDAGIINGTVWETTVCTRFNWYWILLPATLFTCTAFILIYTIISGVFDAQEQPVWKSSVYPLLFSGLGVASSDEELEMLLSLKDMKARADKMTVKLSNEKGRWKLIEE
ncbi:hypothetical protein G7Y89_g2805 [Cudoniella acicularis]|uniref:Uncharacterized protein n=1 Tax=Cudoniella acicularis TaxID=354080 RepID=A0A8H4RUQ1_9HELO|nr:hypothetical protein G7Y89_g2805 [Cudoniella acicularis]